MAEEAQIPGDEIAEAAAAAETGASAATPRRRRHGEERAGGGASEIHRGNIALNVALQLLCVFVLFYLVNHLSVRHYKRVDLSLVKKYSISSDTAAYLERLDEKVRITMAFLSGSKIRGQLQSLLEEYERLADGQIVFEEFDPVRDKNRAYELADRTGIPIDEKNAVYIDIGGKVKRVTEIEMLDDNGATFAGEAAITSAMIAATEGRPKTVYLIAGKGRLREANGRTALEELIDLRERQFFDLKELTLGNVTQVPPDADALLLINPESDFSPEEISVLADYWENARGSLVLLLNPGTEMPNLFVFLRERGVNVQGKYRVLFSETTGIGGTQKRYAVQAKFLSGSPITSGDVGAITTFGGQTCPLQVAENNTGLAARGIIAKPLLEADPKFWGDLAHTEPSPTLDAGDLKPPIYVAASIEKGGSSDPIAKLDSSRLVVVGNSTLLDPDHMSRRNAQFVVNSLNWTLDREERIDILPKPARNFRIDPTPSKYRNLFLIVVILMPGIAFCFAVFVWSARRN